MIILLIVFLIIPAIYLLFSSIESLDYYSTTILKENSKKRNYSRDKCLIDLQYRVKGSLILLPPTLLNLASCQSLLVCILLSWEFVTRKFTSVHTNGLARKYQVVCKKILFCLVYIQCEFISMWVAYFLLVNICLVCLLYILVKALLPPILQLEKFSPRTCTCQFMPIILKVFLYLKLHLHSEKKQSSLNVQQHSIHHFLNNSKFLCPSISQCKHCNCSSNTKFFLHVSMSKIDSLMCILQ